MNTADQPNAPRKLPVSPTPADLRKAADCFEATYGSGSDTAQWLRDKAAAIENGPMKRRGMRPETIACFHRIHELWQQNKTVYEIGAALHMSTAGVTSNICRARNLYGLCPRRKPSTLRRPTPGVAFPKIDLPIGLLLFGKFQGEQFTAHISARGVCVEGIGTFDSLSTAAMQSVARRCGRERLLNGWDFWRVRLSSSTMCRASNLRLTPELIQQAECTPPALPPKP